MSLKRICVFQEYQHSTVWKVINGLLFVLFYSKKHVVDIGESILTNIHSMWFFGVLNTIFLNISYHLSHLELRILSIRIVVITSFCRYKEVDCNKKTRPLTSQALWRMLLLEDKKEEYRYHFPLFWTGLGLITLTMITIPNTANNATHEPLTTGFIITWFQISVGLIMEHKRYRKNDHKWLILYKLYIFGYNTVA